MLLIISVKWEYLLTTENNLLVLLGIFKIRKLLVVLETTFNKRSFLVV